MINVNELKNGVAIEYDGQLCQIIDFMHVLQNKVAFVRVKMKNLRTGAIIETALKGSEQKFKHCFIDHKDMQYLYSNGGSYAFMDLETYEQLEIPSERLKWESHFMIEGQTCKLMLYNGEVLNVELPDKVELKVKECGPVVKGDSTGRKKAILETGHECMIPVFIDQETKIIVETVGGTYVSRA